MKHLQIYFKNDDDYNYVMATIKKIQSDELKHKGNKLNNSDAVLVIAKEWWGENDNINENNKGDTHTSKTE